jgi:periplasmic divalent cation tolerance protein
VAYCVVLTTASSIQEARKLAGFLLEKRLAACVNLIPSVESHYRWKDKREKASEVLLLIKTESRQYRQLEASLKSRHSYSVPEIIQIPIRKGYKSYLQWISENLR